MVFDIVSPILGFEDIKKVKYIKIDDYFSRIESKDQKREISFTLIETPKIRKYEFEIPKFYKDLLQIEQNTSILIYSIVIIQNPIQNSTMNLLAPLILNLDKKLLAQITLDSAKYPDFNILEPIKRYI